MPMLIGQTAGKEAASWATTRSTSIGRGNGRRLTQPSPLNAGLLHPARRLPQCPGGQRVLHGVGEQPLLFIPGAGAAVQRRNARIMSATRETLSQHPAQEVMITIPAPLVIQRNEEQVGAFEVFEGAPSQQRAAWQVGRVMLQARPNAW